MTRDPRRTPPNTNMNCEHFFENLHHRRDLTPPTRQQFDAHAGTCDACAVRLKEARQLDRVLVRWEVPEARPGLVDRVILALAPRTLSCEEVGGEVHDFASGEGSPQLRREIQEHLDHCADCAELVREAEELRDTVEHWTAPALSSNFSARIERTLQREIEESATNLEIPVQRRGLKHLLLGELRIPRVAAALVLIAAGLALANLWQAMGPDPVVPTEPVASDHGRPPVSETLAPSLRTVALYNVEPGGFDLTDSFSGEYVPRRGWLLRSARTR